MFYALLALIGLCVGLVALAGLSARPGAALEEARGLYAEELGPQPFRWTSSQVDFPLHARSGPTRVDLRLGTAAWPGHSESPVSLAGDGVTLAHFTVTRQIRRYKLLLSPSTTALSLRTPVARPPGSEWRWLGAQVFGFSAAPSGLPLREAGLSLLLAVASIPLALLARWLMRGGYGPIIALTAIGLVLRVVMLQSAPPGFHRDEAVSLVDAWNLAQTGRDHLGNLLPLGAFEAYGDWISPLLTYLELPWVALFGPRPLVARLVMAAVGALAAPVVFGLARSLKLPPVSAACAALVIAISPWQVFLSRVAIPPGLVATSWALCLWAAVLLVRRGGRREMLWLALASGIAIYAYPTMKLAVPLLTALALALALWRHGWRAGAAWLLPALLLALLWSPFLATTLFNPASGARLDQIGLKADSPAAWLSEWWPNYTLYFRPDFYYISGDARKVIRAVPGHGMELAAEAPLLLIGLGALLVRAIGYRRSGAAPERAAAPTSPGDSRAETADTARLLIGALLIAPLPASLTASNPNAFRAATIIPLYALLAGFGAAAAWRAIGALPRVRWRRAARIAGAGALAVALALQSGAWLADLALRYPPIVAGVWFFEDGALETMQRVVGYAPKYDEVWLDTLTIGKPYIFLLAAQPMPPAQAQTQMLLKRQPPATNYVMRIERYRFYDLINIPADLPALEAIPDRFGRPAFVIQEWRRENQRVLLVRGASELPPDDRDSTTSDSAAEQP